VPRPPTGSIYRTKDGYGIRWLEAGRRPQQAGFRTRTAAREWFNETVAPRLRRGGPSAELTLHQFAAIYQQRWGPTVSPRTRRTLQEWLAPALQAFGLFTLRELEGGAADIARWRAALPSDDRRYKSTRALRQVLAAAVRWRYLAANPALDAGANPQPRPGEVLPFTRQEIDMLAEELAPEHASLIVFAAETGLRTNEWTAVERRDIDRRNPAVAVARRFASGRATPYPKTARRRVPLTERALAALERLPPRLDSPLLFPAPGGGHLRLDNWRVRAWYPALEAAGLRRRGPYELRHTFASEALASGVSIWQLSRLMGASVETIEQHYGHLVRDAEDHLRVLLNRQAGGGDMTNENQAPGA
jgi:integrase